MHRHIKGERLVLRMSYVTVLLIKDDKVYVVSMHYKRVRRFIDEGFEGVLRLLKSRFLDAGYIVLDANKNVIINGQNAFAIGKTVGKKKFLVVEP